MAEAETHRYPADLVAEKEEGVDRASFRVEAASPCRDPYALAHGREEARHEGVVACLGVVGAVAARYQAEPWTLAFLGNLDEMRVRQTADRLRPSSFE